VEDVAVEQCHGLIVASEVVEQGDLFEQEVIALGNECGVLLQVGEALGMRATGNLVELVELHEDAAIGGVEAEGTLHIFEGEIAVVLLIIIV